MKKSIESAYTSKTIFTGKTNSSKNQYQISKSSYHNKKEIFIDYLTSESLQIKYLVKEILASPF